MTTVHPKQALEELYLLEKKKPKILRSRTILEQIPSKSLIARTEFSRHTSFKPVSSNAAGVTEATSRNIDSVSKLDYADLVFYPLPQFLLRRLQRVEFAAASFVLGHYVKNFRDVLKIGWLPINERRDLNLLKSCFKALHNTETWPDYLKIIKQECRKELRSSNSIRLVVLTENDTFQDNASKLFNNLPETIRNCKDYRTFLRLSRNFLRNRVQSD